MGRTVRLRSEFFLRLMIQEQGKTNTLFETFPVSFDSISSSNSAFYELRVWDVKKSLILEYNKLL